METTQPRTEFSQLEDRTQSKIIDFIQGEGITTIQVLQREFESISQQVYSQMRTGAYELMEKHIEPVFAMHLRKLVNKQEL